MRNTTNFAIVGGMLLGLLVGMLLPQVGFARAPRFSSVHSIDVTKKDREWFASVPGEVVQVFNVGDKWYALTLE